MTCEPETMCATETDRITQRRTRALFLIFGITGLFLAWLL